MFKKNQFKFINSDGIEENVEKERWVWGVIYKDGTELHQFDSNCIFHQFKEIDTENVSMFTMYKFDDMNKRIDMPITEGVKFFHLYTLIANIV